MESGDKSNFDGEHSMTFSTLIRITDKENTNEKPKIAEKNIIKETGDRNVQRKFVERDVGKIVYHHIGTSTDNRIPKKHRRLEDMIYQKLSKNDENLQMRWGMLKEGVAAKIVGRS